MATRPTCAHCGRTVPPSGHSGIVDLETGRETAYCSNRRTCRRALHEAWSDNPTHVRLPVSRDAVSTETLGAALIAFDYVELPWWLRIVPDRWLRPLRSSVAEQVGGAVESSVRKRGLVQAGRVETADLSGFAQHIDEGDGDG